MRFVRIIFLIALFIVPSTVTAQVRITQGYLHIINNVPAGQINTSFGFSQDTFASRGFGRDGAPLVFLQNRSINGFTHTAEPTAPAFGSYWTCVNQLKGHPSQPLSTRFQLTLGTFRVPSVTKSGFTRLLYRHFRSVYDDRQSFVSGHRNGSSHKNNRINRRVGQCRA